MELQTVQDNKQNSGGMMEVAISRQAQEVQSQMVIAQKFPRDSNRSVIRILTECERVGLAEKAMYSYPRGGQTVTGPSIRLAETIAKNYGNLNYGVVELERKSAVGNLFGESIMMAYCWDLETNTRSEKVFTVRHARDKKVKQGNQEVKIVEKLTDERDIYEMVANFSARRLRASILAIVPVDIVEKAVERCKLTLKSGSKPLEDSIREMLLAFKQLGVSQEMLEKHLGHKSEVINRDELVELQGIFNSIKSGEIDRSDIFEMASNNTGDTQTPPAEPQQPKPQTEPKTITPSSVKNFAPQSQAEAASKQSTPAQQSDAGPSQQQAPAQEQQATTETKQADQSERIKFINSILDVQKEKKIKLATVKFYVAKVTGNKDTQMLNMTDEQLVKLYQHLVADEGEQQ